mmetsp:Transcript_17712/g.44626  ORF Transcript_17712/g.44626 Transcript_17712/m.44626 type:complete len:280 (-) Transcript_17712:1721-2560(-)
MPLLMRRSTPATASEPVVRPMPPQGLRPDAEPGRELRGEPASISDCAPADSRLLPSAMGSEPDTGADVLPPTLPYAGLWPITKLPAADEPTDAVLATLELEERLPSGERPGAVAARATAAASAGVGVAEPAPLGSGGLPSGPWAEEGEGSWSEAARPMAALRVEVWEVVVEVEAVVGALRVEMGSTARGTPIRPCMLPMADETARCRELWVSMEAVMGGGGRRMDHAELATLLAPSEACEPLEVRARLWLVVARLPAALTRITALPLWLGPAARAVLWL